MPADDGAETSFTAFVRASGERHLRVAVLLTGNWHAAEDLVQTSLAKLYRAWPGIDQTGGDPDAYLRRIMINTQRSWWRARWRREAPTAELPDAPGVDGDGDQRALAVSVRQALGRLSPRQRAVLVLRYFEDLPEAEIASLLGCSAGSVKAHAHRGLRALRAELGGLDGQWPPDGPAGEPSAGDRGQSGATWPTEAGPTGVGPAGVGPTAAEQRNPALSDVGGTAPAAGSDTR